MVRGRMKKTDGVVETFCVASHMHNPPLQCLVVRPPFQTMSKDNRQAVQSMTEKAVREEQPSAPFRDAPAAADDAAGLAASSTSDPANRTDFVVTTHIVNVVVGIFVLVVLLASIYVVRMSVLEQRRWLDKASGAADSGWSTAVSSVLIFSLVAFLAMSAYNAYASMRVVQTVNLRQQDYEEMVQRKTVLDARNLALNRRESALYGFRDSLVTASRQIQSSAAALGAPDAARPVQRALDDVRVSEEQAKKLISDARDLARDAARHPYKYRGPAAISVSDAQMDSDTYVYGIDEKATASATTENGGNLAQKYATVDTRLQRVESSLNNLGLLKPAAAAAATSGTTNTDPVDTLPPAIAVVAAKNNKPAVKPVGAATVPPAPAPRNNRVR